MSEPLTFVDRTPSKNATYTPSEPTPGTRSLPDNMTIAPAEPSDPSFFGRVMHFVSYMKAYKDERFSTLKPWSDFFDRKKFSVPGKLEAFSRVNKNVAFFYSNYVVVAFLSSLYVLITNFAFMMSMGLAAAVYFFLRMKSSANEPVVIFGREVSLYQSYAGLIGFTVVSFFLTGGSSTVFWLIMSSLGTVAIHAALREPPAETNEFSFV